MVTIRVRTVAAVEALAALRASLGVGFNTTMRRTTQVWWLDHSFKARKADEGLIEPTPDVACTLERTEVTAANLQSVADNLPALDQAESLAVGCVTWGIFYEPWRQRGQITTWPNGRAAIMLGADSEWGDWDEKSSTLTLDALDPANDLIMYNAQGARL